MSNEKIILILLDGMRPDALEGIEQVEKLKKESAYTLNASTVMPSVTLPCHMSLFHSVDPERHGIVTNTFTPQVRPIDGLCDVLYKAGKKCAFFYDWENLRDLSLPGSLAFSFFCAQKIEGLYEGVLRVAEETIRYNKVYSADFSFVYFGLTDEIGHKYGWMSDEYNLSMRQSWEQVEKIMNELGDEYTYIVTADHGGHGRGHGTDMPEDMTIPMFFKGKNIKPGVIEKAVNIKDIAPTVTKLEGVAPAEEWEGVSVL